MLTMLHNILDMPIPLGIKHMNVCYKHSDLLKQARERCLLTKEESNKVAQKQSQILKKSDNVSFSIDNTFSDHGILGGLEAGINVEAGPGRDEDGVFVMDQQTGQLINLFDCCQPILDMYCGQLTNESAQFL